MMRVCDWTSQINWVYNDDGDGDDDDDDDDYVCVVVSEWLPWLMTLLVFLSRK